MLYRLTLQGEVHIAAVSDSDAITKVRAGAASRGIVLSDELTSGGQSQVQELPGHIAYDVSAGGQIVVEAPDLLDAVKAFSLSPDPALRWWRLVAAEEVRG